MSLLFQNGILYEERLALRMHNQRLEGMIMPTRKRSKQLNYKQSLLRQRLDAVLQEASQKHAVTIVAEAGYGKSLAVSSFLSLHKSETVWIYLTHLDNTDTRIWESISSAFGKMLNETQLCFHNFNFPAKYSTFENFKILLRNALDPNKKYYLVLDDCHNITNPAFFEFIERLILERIPNLCVFLMSRQEIPFHTIRLIGKGLLTQIDYNTLRLTQEELSDYFEQQGILLMDQATSEFYQYTGGWFFAAHLLCLVLKKGQLYKTNPFSTIQLDVFRLLESGVYSTLSDEVKRNLLRFSLFERLPVELAALLAGDEWPLVHKAINIHTFIEHDRFNNTIHIHPLFLQFLHLKRDMLSKSEQETVHLLSAQWFEQSELYIDAIFHYEKIQRYDRILTILLTFTKAYPAKTMEFLLGVINRMPDSLLDENPVLHFLRIKFQMNNFDMREVNQKLLEFCQWLEQLKPTPKITEALGEVYIHLAFQSLIMCGISRTYEFDEYFQMAYTCIPHGSKLIHKPYISNGNYNCNVSSPIKGEIDRFIASVQRMLPYATGVLPNTFEGYDNLAKAEYAYFQKDLGKADQYLQQALRDSHAAQSTYIEISALYLETRINVAAGNYRKAQNAIEQQKKLVQYVNSMEGYAVHDMTTSWFYCQLGYTHMISNWIKDEEKSKEVLTPVTFATDKLIRAQCLLQENKLYELLAMLNTKEEGFHFENYLFGRIEMTVLKAIALHLTKEHTQALLALEEAYVLAAPNGLILPFVEYGKYMRTLLSKIHHDIGIPHEWLNDIKTKSATYSKRISTIKADYRLHQIDEKDKPVLSRRENEVLGAIIQNLTHQEIADSLNLSVNTVKSITRSIYNKLGANSNVEAVRIATQFDLI